MMTRIQTVQLRRKQAAKRRIWRRRCLLSAMVIFAVVVGLNRAGDDSVQKVPASGQIIRVYNAAAGTLMELDLEMYLVGVVAAEMPASFELEALKAQAVAARTFALNRIQHPNGNVTALHPQAQITTSPETCQAWIDDATQRQHWGNAYETWRNKIAQAVSMTRGEVLYYEDVLIEPVYHASCGGGYTEAAEHVWGNASPYLVSVVCSHPADQHSNETTVLSLQELEEKLGLQGVVTAGSLYGENSYLQILQRTESNRVKEIRIGDKTIRGGELRSALGLKSTLLDWEIRENDIVFTTNGYGHGAGMCQYGADYYAAQGCDYRQILQHYYPGTTIGAVK